jgi:hypothetical protein
MDWVQIAIVAIAVLGACFAFYAKKAEQRKPYYPPELNTLENPKVCKPPRPWAEDPIAKAIEWCERAEGGGGVGHELRYVGSSRVEFRPVHPKSWYIITLLMAVGAAAIVYLQFGSIGQTFLALLGGTVFCAFGWLFFYLSLTPVVFDKSRGIFWIGRKQPCQVSCNPQSKGFGRIDDIYALQLILTYYVTGVPGDIDNRTYPQYQINLVMKNSKRINVVTYSSSDTSDRLSKNANALAMFLEKPLWDNR